MKLLILAFVILFASCKQSKNDVLTKPIEVVQEETPENFFPVTDYIKGQIAELKSDGINPLILTSIGNHEDSSWLKVDSFNIVFAEFLNPVIDTTNFKPFFKESKFLDQSIPAYTWTYDPIKNLPDSISLRHWDVYVNPETSKVDRIFIKKALPGNIQLQLTWVANNYAKIVSIKDNNTIEKDITIKWRFD